MLVIQQNALKLCTDEHACSGHVMWVCTAALSHESLSSEVSLQGTNAEYDVDQTAPPNIFNHSQCGITSSQLFWSGATVAHLVLQVHKAPNLNSTMNVLFAHHTPLLCHVMVFQP